MPKSSDLSNHGPKTTQQQRSQRRTSQVGTGNAAQEVSGTVWDQQQSEQLLPERGFGLHAFQHHAALLGESAGQPTNAQQKTLIARQLQRDYGNNYVHRLMETISRPGVGRVQPKLEVGPAGDQYEREADDVAKQVMGSVSSSNVRPETQRQDLEEEELQMKPLSQRQIGLEGGTVDSEMEDSIRKVRGQGQPLPDNVRSSMEGAFKADFRGIRVHTGAESEALNQSISARAFTTGSDIFLGRNEYSPGSAAGQELLAHELTHVVQQGGAGDLNRDPAQRQDGVEEDELLQGKLDSVRRQDGLEEDEVLQGKLDGVQRQDGLEEDELLQGKLDGVQRQEGLEEDELIQGKPDGVQRLDGDQGPTKLQRAVHESPATTEIRLALPNQFLGGDDALQYLAQKAKDVMAIPNTINITSDLATFEKEFAKYLSVQEVGDESQADLKLPAAKKQIADADCRAFTNQKSQTWYYGAQPALSDQIHEMVHILSAPGGLTPILAEYGAGLNEGFTHLFTTKVCKAIGVTVKPAYKKPTEFATRLDATYGTPMMYQAYFKGNMDGLLGAMAKKYESYANSGKLGNKKAAGWSDKDKSIPERKEMIKAKLKDWQSNGKPWLDARIF